MPLCSSGWEAFPLSSAEPLPPARAQSCPTSGTDIVNCTLTVSTRVNLPGVGPVTQTTPVTIDTTYLQPNGGTVTVRTPNGTVSTDVGSSEVRVDRIRTNGKKQKSESKGDDKGGKR